MPTDDVLSFDRIRPTRTSTPAVTPSTIGTPLPTAALTATSRPAKPAQPRMMVSAPWVSTSQLAFLASADATTSLGSRSASRTVKPLLTTPAHR